MPGYASDLVMAGGTFIDGSTSEFSADAPLREPFNLYVQGGTHRAHVGWPCARPGGSAPAGLWIPHTE